jgi:hypothetical protein
MGPWGETTEDWEEEDGVRLFSAQVRVEVELQAVVASPGAPKAMAAAVGKRFSMTTRGGSHGPHGRRGRLVSEDQGSKLWVGDLGSR